MKGKMENKINYEKEWNELKKNVEKKLKIFEYNRGAFSMGNYDAYLRIFSWMKEKEKN